ncbi:MAG: DNA ligase [Actinomycetota bacterium]|nr:DNA ligase [Actinomycetota bacterium]
MNAKRTQVEAHKREPGERLETYRGKRDFGSTREPAPKGKGGGKVRGRAGDPVFVVQEHAASTHHYDVRLEVDGVLVSWSVPKGPSTDPKEKRLAVPTEDHPMEYAQFEGTIPQGEYGGGSVIVWDAGTYRNLTERKGEAVDMRAGLDEGHVSVWLEGRKLVGGWAFTRTGDNWILVKRRDDEADARRNPVSTQPESVLSGRTVDDVAEGEEDVG